METGFLNFESFTTDFYDPDINNVFDGSFTGFGSEIDRIDNFSSVYYNPEGVQRMEKAEDFQKTIQDWDRHVDLQSLSIESELSPDCAVKDEPSYELPNLFFSPLDEIKIEPLQIDFDDIDTIGDISDIDDLLKEEAISDSLLKNVPCNTVPSPSTTKSLPSQVPERHKKRKIKFQKPSLIVKIKLTDEIKQMLKNDGLIPLENEDDVSQNKESVESDVNCDKKEEVINAKPRDNQGLQITSQHDEIDIEEGEISSESDGDEIKQDVKEEVQIEDLNKPKKKLNLEEYRSRMKKMARSNTPENVNNNGFKTGVVPRETHCRRKRDYRRVSDSSSFSGYSSRSRRSRTRSLSKRSYRSSSRSRSRSSRSYSSSSRSRSRSRNRRRSRRASSSRSRGSYRRERISPERYARRLEEWAPVDRLKQVEERRVVYVGKIPEGTTKAHLRERFDKFGPIVDITLHFRERNNNYGFVTFVSKSHAYYAVEHGNDKQDVKYDICFGGRRAFCKQKYHDLDSAPVYNQQQIKPINSYDQLLKKAQEKLKKKKV